MPDSSLPARRAAAANSAAIDRRASPRTTLNRNGTSAAWSGACSAASVIAASAASSGPGSIKYFGPTDARVSSSFRAWSFMAPPPSSKGLRHRAAEAATHDAANQ